MVSARLVASLVLVVLSVACGPSPAVLDAGAGDLIVDSPQIDGGAFASAQTCDGGDHAPEIRWSPLPTGGRSAVVEMLDPDAPGGTFTHWLAYADSDSGSTAGGAWIEGANDFGGTGYRGPCPPKGQTHHYHVSVIVLASPLGSGAHALSAGFHRGDLDAAVAARSALRSGELVATYGR